MKVITSPLRKCKTWMESFAEKPSAMTSLFFLSLAESSFFPIPPDVLLLAIGVSQPQIALKAALWCTLGSVIGGVLGYYIGSALMDVIGKPIIAFYGADYAMENFNNFYDDWGYWFLAVAAFTPIPYKVATIASGMMGMAIIPFVIISSLGRAARFFIVATLLYYKGPKIKDFIEKYFDKLSIALVILIVLGFLAIKFFPH
ncbi:MAG: YqaA family protein [Candidatus Kapaibacteriales bacterium]